MTRHLLCALGVTLLVGAASGCGGTKPCDPDAPNTICTIAGNGQIGYDGDGGPAVDATFYYPMDTIIGPDGLVWIADFNNYAFRSVDKDGLIHTVIGTGLLGDSPLDGAPPTPALQASFNHSPTFFMSPDKKYIYIAAWHNSRVKRVNVSDMTVENIAGTGQRTFYSGDEGPATQATVDLPGSVATDPNGNVVFMDQANQVIRMIDQNGVIHRLAGQCIIDDVTPCAPGQMPVACPAPSDKLTCGDPATTCEEQCTGAFSGDGGPALQMRMNQPFKQFAYPAGRLVYDKQGNLYFADSGNNRVRMIDTQGIVHTVAGNGTAGYGGDGGPATAAELDQPIDLAVADDGTLYIADHLNNCIRKVDPSGTITTAVGKCHTTDGPDEMGHSFAGDGGPPTEATLNWPFGIDLAGNKLYVTDTYNNRIRVVNLK